MSAKVTGVILAGGRGTRMDGQDKGLLDYRGQRLVEYIVARFAPQVDELIINANRNEEIYSTLGHPVIADSITGFAGPLAGMLAGLEHAAHEQVVFIPCDSPVVPDDLVARLLNTAKHAGSQVAIAHDGHRLQPLHALISRSRLSSLEDYLASGERRTDAWMQSEAATTVMFKDFPNGFINLNTPADLQSCE
jgi:molybdopterin-guanine dinucleotide biosynthesis protein A